jgi:hypothetical protein
VAIRIRAAAGWKKLSQPCCDSIARLLRPSTGDFLKGVWNQIKVPAFGFVKTWNSGKLSLGDALIKVMTNIHADRMEEENAASFVRTRFKMSYP